MKTKNLYLFFILSFFVILTLYSPLFVKTGGNFVLASVNEVILPGLGENPTLPQYISFIFNFVMQLAGSLAVLAVTFGGLRYLASFGNPTAKNAGKEWVKAGILGLLLLMCSYLILYTINKDLVSLEITPLGIPLLKVNFPERPKIPKTSEMIYVELPIGTLTENTLSRASDYCYDFDLNGDPIDDDLKTSNIYEPTIKNHDRLDCALKIYEAVEKKSKISDLLSKKIAELMNTCQCAGNCDQNCATCKWKGGTCPRDEKYIGTTTPCTGDCVNSSCKQNPAKNVCPNVCVKNNNILKIDVGTDTGKQACIKDGGVITGVKEITENGPIKITVTCPECNEKTYKGLNEFRTTRTEISSFVEIEIIVDGKKVKFIQKDKWNQLKLIEQLMYLKEKTNKIKEELKIDSDALKQAENETNKCYLVKSSVDFWKIAEKNDSITNGEIIIQKPFKDPVAEKNNEDCKNISAADALKDCEKDASSKYCKCVVDSSKYCKGYNYSDSSSFSFCRKMCFPTASPESFKGLKACDKDNFKCLEDNFYKCTKNSFGFTNMQECLTGYRSECSKSCDIKYPKCPDPTGPCKKDCEDNASVCLNNCWGRYTHDYCRNIYCRANNPGCLEYCWGIYGHDYCQSLCSVDNCKKRCELKYNCSDENKNCKDACGQDSEYILNQDENCFGNNFKAVKNCADAYDISDFESFKRCIESSTCSFCTDQYAGYPDCSKNIGSSSSLYLYQNPSQLKAPYCYQDPKIKEENKKCKSSCGDDIACSSLCDGKYPVNDTDKYPECQKCPNCSICPKCPCKDGCSITCDAKYPKDPDKSKECKKTCSNCSAYCDINYSEGSDGNKACKKTCGDQNENCSQLEEKALFCSADCVESAYNQDPLTFYCRTKWWEEANSGTGKENTPNNTNIIKEINETTDITQEEKSELLKEANLATTIYAQTLYCQKREEIPIGETVDGTEAWADNMIKFLTENAIKKLDGIDGIIGYIKQIGNEADYCKCDSKCSSTEKTCQSSCIYGQSEITNPITGKISWSCFCSKTPCAGNPCQKIINLLLGKKKTDGCPKNIEYKGVAWYQQEITKSFDEFKKIVLQGDRSDLLKKLVYSRKKMSECGVASNIFEKEKSTISCTIARDYLIEPISSWSIIINGKKINNQCYGGWLLNRIVGNELMNNWECCDLFQKSVQPK